MCVALSLLLAMAALTDYGVSLVSILPFSGCL